MSTDLKILIFEPPAGHTFELINRTRGLCFRLGFFSQLACCGASGRSDSVRVPRRWPASQLHGDRLISRMPTQSRSFVFDIVGWITPRKGRTFFPQGSCGSTSKASLSSRLLSLSRGESPTRPRGLCALPRPRSALASLPGQGTGLLFQPGKGGEALFEDRLHESWLKSG